MRNPEFGPKIEENAESKKYPFSIGEQFKQAEKEGGKVSKERYEEIIKEEAEKWVREHPARLAEIHKQEEELVELGEQLPEEIKQEKRKIFASAKKVLLDFGKMAKERAPSKKAVFRAATAAVIVSNIFLSQGTSREYTQQDTDNAPAEAEQILSPEELAARNHAYDLLIENADNLEEADVDTLKDNYEKLSGNTLSKPQDLLEVTLDEGENGPAMEEEGTEVHIEIERFEPSVAVLDIKTSSLEEINAFLQEALGDDYVSREQLIAEFGNDYEERWQEIAKKYPKALAYAYMDIYKNHGDNVIGVAEKIWDLAKNDAGLENVREFEVLPLQKAISFADTANEQGESGVSITVDEYKIIKLLEDTPDRVINFSFQAGKIEAFVEKHRVKADMKIPTREDINVGPGAYDDKGNFHVAIPEHKPMDNSVTGVTSVTMYIQVESKDAARKMVESDPLIRGNLEIGSYVDFYDKNGLPLGYAHIEETDGILAPVPVIPREEIESRLAKAKEEVKKQIREIEEKEVYKLRIVGAYAREKAEENLPKLFEVARAYPDKLFVAAGGNEGEDVREAMEKLGDERPNNLIIVAQWDLTWGTKRNRPKHEMHGADIYFPNSAYNIPEGSSFSTPAITAYAAILFEKGLSMEEVLEKIKSTTDIVEYTTRDNGAEKIQARVLMGSRALGDLRDLRPENLENQLQYATDPENSKMVS